MDFGIFIDNFFDTARAFLFIQRANKEAVERLKDKSQTPIGALHLSRLDILIDTLLNVKISKYFQVGLYIYIYIDFGLENSTSSRMYVIICRTGLILFTSLIPCSLPPTERSTNLASTTSNCPTKVWKFE